MSTTLAIEVKSAPASALDGAALRGARVVLVLLALAYALFAGLHTVADFDTGWQLATARYVVQHHQIPATDVLSYTTAGRPWLYPPFAGVLLYGIYTVWGYAGVSWFCALAGVAVAAYLLLSDDGIATAALLILAVPAIAYRTGPRADLFSTAFFAVFLAELWAWRQGRRARLWLLPPLMLFWVNLHGGFIAGLGVVAAYVFMEACDLFFSRRAPAPAAARLRRAAPWLAATTAATLLNPWGVRIYGAALSMAGLGAAAGQSGPIAGELLPVPMGMAALRQAVDFRNPEGAFWWLVALAVVAGLIAAWRRQWGALLVLAAAVYMSLQHVRYQALFAITVVVLAGTLLKELLAPRFSGVHPGGRRAALLALLLAAGVLVGVRVADLVSNRYYVVSSATAQFGAGESWWFPERAAAFIEREHLPANIFQEYGMGGFAAWRLAPQYPVFIDGRGIDPAIFVEQQQVLASSPDSPAWQQEATRRHINVLLFSLARFGGLGSIDLQAYCASTEWRPVYLDEVSAVFLRNLPENRAWLDRLTLDCRTQPLSPGAAFSRAGWFNYYANAAGVYFVLARDVEAQAALDGAEAIYPFDPSIHLTRAQLWEQQGRLADAEREYRAALTRKQSDGAWYGLANLYAQQHRYEDAHEALMNAAALAAQPYAYYKSLGRLELLRQRPQRALAMFARAEKECPFRGALQSVGNEFYAQLEEGRAQAYRLLGQLPEAIAHEQHALQRTPDNARRWSVLAELYQLVGESRLAEQAQQRAGSLQGR